MDARSFQAAFVAVRSNKLFEIFVISVILASALLVGVKTYEISAGMRRLTNVLDLAVTLFFVIEIVIRFIATENRRRFFHDFWNCFDTLIVLVSLVPVDNADMALVARLVRVFRVLRMVSFIPELRVLLVSLVKALPQLGYVMLLLFIIFYIYAAIGSTLFETINADLWGDIAVSMLTLFRVMTFEDWTDVMYETMAAYPLSWIYYVTFIFFHGVRLPQHDHRHRGQRDGGGAPRHARQGGGITGRTDPRRRARAPGGDSRAAGEKGHRQAAMNAPRDGLVESGLRSCCCAEAAGWSRCSRRRPA